MNLIEYLKHVPAKFLIIGSFLLLALLAITTSLLTRPNNTIPDSQVLPTAGASINNTVTTENLARMTPEQKQKILDTSRKDLSGLSFDDRTNITLSHMKLPVQNADFEMAFSFHFNQYLIYQKSAGAEAALKTFLQNNKLYSLYLNRPDLFINVNKPVLQAIAEKEQPLLDIYHSMDDNDAPEVEPQSKVKWSDILDISVSAQVPESGEAEGNRFIEILKRVRIGIGTEGSPANTNNAPDPGGNNDTDTGTIGQLDGTKLTAAEYTGTRVGTNSCAANENGSVAPAVKYPIPPAEIVEGLLNNPNAAALRNHAAQIRGGEIDPRLIYLLYNFTKTNKIGVSGGMKSCSNASGSCWRCCFFRRQASGCSWANGKGDGMTQHAVGGAIDIMNVNDVQVVDADNNQAAHAAVKKALDTLNQMSGSIKPTEVGAPTAYSPLESTYDPLFYFRSDHDNHIHIGFTPVF